MEGNQAGPEKNVKPSRKKRATDESLRFIGRERKCSMLQATDIAAGNLLIH